MRWIEARWIRKPTMCHLIALPHAIKISTALLIACLALSCRAPEENAVKAAPHAASLELFDLELELEDGSSLAYERGILTVPVRRDDPSSSSIGVEFFRFRRTKEASPETPPIVLLHGGPGYPGLGPRLAGKGYFESRLARYTDISDVIVPGQRGFGSSGATPCEPLRTLSVEEALDADIRHQAIRQATARCREKWLATGLDLTGFNIIAAAADVADIAKHLGYEKIQLRGISFGSHWGMAVLRYHPDLVERAILASLEGPDHTYDDPGGVLATLERIASAAESSPQLASRIPSGGLIKAYADLIARADAASLVVEAEHPETGEMITVSLDGADLRQIFSGTRRFTTFRYRTANWPLVMLEILEGDLKPAAESQLWNLLKTQLEDAAYYQLDCGSGVSQARGERIRHSAAAAMLGPTWLRIDVPCESWHADLGAEFRGPFLSSIPTILVHGDWDTATPFENALELRPYFENHRFVQVIGGSHGALREALEQVEGFQQAMDHWLATGELEQIPESLELPPLEWKADFEDS